MHIVFYSAALWRIFVVAGAHHTRVVHSTHGSNEGGGRQASEFPCRVVSMFGAMHVLGVTK